MMVRIVSLYEFNSVLRRRTGVGWIAGREYWCVNISSHSKDIQYDSDLQASKPGSACNTASVDWHLLPH